MGLSRISFLLAALALWIAPPSAQTIQAPRCLHGESETQAQAERREEALDATDMINRALERQPRGTAFPTWEALAKSPAIASLRSMLGRQGELARRMDWGSDLPLPGWRIHYVAARDSYAFSLTDIRDPCRLTLVSNDTGVVLEARPANRRGRPRVIPLDSTQ
jgi:hypothetical protein